MSDENATNDDAVTDETAQSSEVEGQEVEQEKQGTDWRAEARKWEQRAKDNKSAADRLAELEQAQMSEAEKAEARVKAAEERAAELEASNARKDVAIECGLSKEDAELLNDLTDPDAMRRLAARLGSAGSSPRTPKPDPNQGRGQDKPPSSADAFSRFIDDSLGQ